MRFSRVRKVSRLIGTSSTERLERLAAKCGPLEGRAEEELYLRNIDDPRIAQAMGRAVGIDNQPS